MSKKRACSASSEIASPEKSAPNTKKQCNGTEITTDVSYGHPYGVKPWGNYMLDGNGSNIRGSSLGNLSLLNDEAILIVLSMVSARDLCRLAQASRVLYVFSHHSDFWRDQTLKHFGGEFSFTGNWKVE
jgi:hypothetical protein